MGSGAETWPQSSACGDLPIVGDLARLTFFLFVGCAPSILQRYTHVCSSNICRGCLLMLLFSRIAVSSRRSDMCWSAIGFLKAILRDFDDFLLQAEVMESLK